MTKRAARPDVARAANHLLRLALEGRITLYLRPPNYKAQESMWQSHPDVGEITNIQALEQNKDDSWLEEADEPEVDEDDASGSDDEDASDEDEEEVAASSNKFALLQDDD